MNDELLVTSDESPRPWRVRRPIDNEPNLVNIEAAGGCIIARNIKDEDAALIVRAVNGREDLLKAREMLQAECRGLAADVAGLASPRLEPIDGSTETTGWHRYVLPDGVRVFGRMELDREMAGRLAAALAHFAKNGALPRKGGAE